MLVFDTEGDGLMHCKVSVDPKTGIKTVEPPATKFHIFGWTTDGQKVHTTTDHSIFTEALSSEKYIACHNAFTHDMPLLKRLHGYTHKGIVMDTLWLSWYLWPSRSEYSLESFEKQSGIKKVKVEKDQWQEGNISLMKERVTNDVLLNWWLVQKINSNLKKLYT